MEERRIQGEGWELRLRWNEDEASLLIETISGDGFSSGTIIPLDLRELTFLRDWMEMARRTISEG
jgi:hypothetical protein